MGSQALVRTHNCGSLSPWLVDVFKRRISRLSRIKRFLCRVFLFLSLYVAMILGSFQLIDPVEQCLACLEIPDIVSSDFVELTSAECCAMRV